MPDTKHRRRKRRHATTTPRGKPTTAAESPRPSPASLTAAAGNAALRHDPARMRIIQALQPLSLVLLIAVCYIPALSAEFVWDDLIIPQSIPVREWSGLWDIWFVPSSLVNEGHYWPLLYSTYWLEHKLWGYAPLGYHVVNILLHVGVTLLLWRLLRRLGAPAAWVVAAIFAVHPVHVEPVTWVIGRKDVLSSLFYLAAAVVYLRFSEGGRIRDFLAVIALFIAAMLSKSTAVTLPFVLLIWHWWRDRNLSATAAARLLLLAAVGLFIALADWDYYRGREVVHFGFSMPERALLAARALWFYVGKLLWPLPLPIVYPRWDMAAIAPLTWLYLPAAVAFGAALWLARRRIGRAAFAAALCYAVILSPTLGFLDTGYMQFSFVADRYQYLAGAALIAVVAGAAACALERFGSVRVTALPVGVLLATLLVTYSAVSWRQMGIYRDNLTFYSHITSHNPAARAAHYHLGREYRMAGRLEEAYETLTIATEKDPHHLWAHIAMGRTLESLERADEAVPYYERAVTIKPNSADAMDPLAVLYTKRERYGEGLALFDRILAITPPTARIYSHRGVALYGLKRYEEALQSFERALALDASFTQARTHRETVLGVIQQEQRRE